MPSDLFDVYVSEKLSQDKIAKFSEALSRNKLADEYMIRQILSRSPISIKKNISRSDASIYERIAKSCGISVEIKSAYSPPATSAPHATTVPRCPFCGSTSIQLVRKGFSFGKSILGTVALGPYGAIAGFASDKYNRVCINCKRSF